MGGGGGPGAGGRVMYGGAQASIVPEPSGIPQLFPLGAAGGHAAHPQPPDRTVSMQEPGEPQP